MPASLGRILFNVGLLSTGLISVLLSLAGSTTQSYLSLGLCTRTKLLHHSTVSSMPWSTSICCFCSISTSFFMGPWSTCATLLEDP